MRLLISLISSFFLVFLLGFQLKPSYNISFTGMISDRIANEYIINTPEPSIFLPEPTPIITPVPTPNIPWIHDKEVSWYGPGLYGNRTACGQRYTTVIMGVAHRTLPCGTLVEFRYKGISVVVPVIDRGPYVRGRIWDLSGALCKFLHHCFTGPIDYRILNGTTN